MATKQIIDPGFVWDKDYQYSQCVRVGDLLFLAGQMPVSAAGELVGEGDISAQTRQVFANLEAVLGAAGTDLSAIVEATCYLTSMADDFEAMWGVKAEYLTRDFPAMTVLGVTGLALPGQLLEIRAIAVAP